MDELLSQFADVAPVEQDDPSPAVVPIAYPEEYATLMGYFRAVSGERSRRVMELTAEILEFNAAHYTVWHTRRACVYAVGDLEDELEYADMVATHNPKNYQIWYHRREILDRLDSRDAALRELAFVSRMIGSDAKNYHAWSHRLWVVKRFECWDNELAVVDALLDEDVWNNSAWNHRYAVARDADCVAEVQYATERALSAPRNESPWIYALAFAKRDEKAAAVLRAACDSLMDAAEPADRACARMTLVDLDVLVGDTQKAAQHARILASHDDPFRAKYWSRKAATLASSC